MSHIIGTIETGGLPLGIGPDHPGPDTINFIPLPAAPATIPPGGIKYIMLHFNNASFPPNTKLEVDLGYSMDVFDANDGTEFWTRPVNVSVLPGNQVPIRYIANGSLTGGVQLVSYGRGERHDDEGLPGHEPGYSNCDPFLKDGSYTEPDYDELWYCNTPPNIPPNWENVDCIPAGDIRRTVAQSVGMFISEHAGHLSSCSVTLIGPDLIITAGHCVEDPDEAVKSMSVIFSYETTCAGGKPMPYNPVFHKAIRWIKYGTLGPGSLDYIIIQIKVPPGGLGIPPIPMRTDLPAVNENVFGIHHPNGAVKKLSRKHSEPYAKVVTSSANAINVSLDVSGGSSGSGLFDTMGRFLGVLSYGPACSLNYSPSATILNHVGDNPIPSVDRDVMIVLDRSGSMAGSAGTTPGKTKMDEAKEAASLFVQLIAAGQGHQLGMVYFSTTATLDEDMGNVNPGKKNQLIGNMPPYNAGKIGALTPSGMTSIGDGLQKAIDELNSDAKPGNKPTIFLLTDGLQNTPPMIANVINQLNNVDIHAVGYGNASSLNGALLTELTQTHNGLYMRAGDGLNLRKFFALSFGNIFEAGTLSDPELVLPAIATQAAPLPFNVCEETVITIVTGWEMENHPVNYRIETPTGKFINWNENGTDSSFGKTWRFTRIPLPFNGEQNGNWKVHVFRESGAGEFSTAAAAIRYFVNVLPKGGPLLVLKNHRRNYYTGEIYNPQVAIFNKNGFPPHHAKAKLIVLKPDEGTGNLLSKFGLKGAVQVDGDTLPARFASLQQLEKEQQKPAVNYREISYELFDDGTHDDGAMEPDGIFGNPLKDLLQKEGDYTFHVIASYGENCTGTRELTWTVHVETGIDTGNTKITSTLISTLPGGKQHVRFGITPKDVYGNFLGPGRQDAFMVSGSHGTNITGSLQDMGNGTYELVAVHDSASGKKPGIIISQPGRDPVFIAEQSQEENCSKWKRWLWLFIALAVLFALLWLISISQ